MTHVKGVRTEETKQKRNEAIVITENSRNRSAKLCVCVRCSVPW